MLDISQSVDYIIEFLINDKEYKNEVTIIYSKSLEDRYNADILIIQSNFFDPEVYLTERSLPRTPLKKVENVPILFGNNLIENIDGCFVIYGDIIASTYFLISRYEELIIKERDIHGRFLAKYSILGKEALENIPLVDEYGAILRKYIRLAGGIIHEKTGIQGINLTHDVDIPWEKFTLRTAGGKCLRSIFQQHKICVYPFLNLLGIPYLDPNYNFNGVIETDHILYKHGVRNIYFLLAYEKKDSFFTRTYIYAKGFQHLLRILEDANVILGWHISYEAIESEAMMKHEKMVLEKVIGERIECARNHYLRTRGPGDFNTLIDMGIQDDFTMGFADKIGFRLGTARSVNWINPLDGKVTCLKLHPLQVMDASLYEKQYMGLDIGASFEAVSSIIDKVKEHCGELTLLWHNNSLVDKEQYNLYKKILYYIKDQCDE